MENVDLDLDALEWEGTNKPFSVKLGGRRYQMVAIGQLDYRELAALSDDSPGDSLRRVLADEDREPFFKNDLPSFKLNALFKAYLAHYQVDAGEAEGSPTS